MAFKAIIEKLDDVPEAFQEHYKKVGDKYHLDTDFKSLGFEDVTNLKAGNTRLKQERQELRDELEPLKKYKPLLEVEDFDPSEIETIMAAAGGSGDKEAIANLERKYGKQIDALKTELEESKTVATTAVTEKDDFIIASSLQSAAVKAKVRAESLDDVVALNRKSVKIVDGKAMMVDADGDPTVTPLEFLTGDYKKEKSHFYEPDGKGGSGHLSKGGNNSDGAAKTYKQDASLKDKVAAMKDKIESRQSS